jgi:hypothetical protein
LDFISPVQMRIGVADQPIENSAKPVTRLEPRNVLTAPPQANRLKLDYRMGSPIDMVDSLLADDACHHARG